MIYLGAYKVPKGVYGGYMVANVVLQQGYLVHVFPFGSHKSPFLPMQFENSREAKWHIENHPNGKRYYTKVSEFYNPNNAFVSMPDGGILHE
jgi:hypothetical protein